MNQVRDLPIIQVQKGKVSVLHPADIKNAEIQKNVKLMNSAASGNKPVPQQRAEIY